MKKLKTGKKLEEFDSEEAPEATEFAADDKYGRVLQRDIDKMTGGMNKVKEYKIDISNFNTMAAFQAPKY